ncbi:hypothetical protein HDU67_008334 [Dinochytrium kinnereticum]|nr:hypothetical protein HDU67_008334 [Dinochytrium kinnereticum]
MEEIELPGIASQLCHSPNNQTIRAFTFKNHPGLVYIPNPFTNSAQVDIITHCLRDWARHPNVTNLDTHYFLPSEGLWNAHEKQQRDFKRGIADTAILERRINTEENGGLYEETQQYPPQNKTPSNVSIDIDPPTSPTPNLVPVKVSDGVRKLRWASIGLQYHWATKEYHTSRNAPIPPLIAELSTAIVKCVEKITGYPAELYDPEAGIINFYQLGDSLTAHQDRSEINKNAPLVSLSLGNSCIFLFGTESREEDVPTPVLLQSGDIVIMSGASRQCFHGVPRILSDTTPQFLTELSSDPDLEHVVKFMSSTRLNINVRQKPMKRFSLLRMMKINIEQNNRKLEIMGSEMNQGSQDVSDSIIDPSHSILPPFTTPRTPRSLHRLKGAPAKDILLSSAPKFATGSSDSAQELPKWALVQQQKAARGGKTVQPLEEIVRDGVRELMLGAEGIIRNPTLDRDKRLVHNKKRHSRLGKGKSIEEELCRLEQEQATGFSRPNLNEKELGKELGKSHHKLSQLTISGSRQLQSTVSLQSRNNSTFRQRSATDSSEKLSNSTQSLASKDHRRNRSKTDSSVGDPSESEGRESEVSDMRNLTPSQSARQLNLRGPDRKPEVQNLDSFMRSKSSALAGSTEYFAPLRGPSKLPPVSREEQRQWDRAYRKGERRAFNTKDFDSYSGRPLKRMDLSSLPNESLRSPLDAMATMSSYLYDQSPSKGYKRSDFEFIDCIGRGSCARIMLGTLTSTTARASDRRPYAVKVMNKSDLVKIPNGAESALNERNIMRTLAHNFVVPYVDSFQDNECLYIVMGFMPFNIRALLEREKRLNDDAARFYVAETSIAIDWLHSKGILYRDVKPDNILIDVEGHIKLCDFGASDRRALDGCNAFIGTGVYMAPEVVLGCTYGKSVDWWGVGSLVYELLAGQAPFARSPGSGASLGARADPESFLNILDAPLNLPKTIFSDQASDLILKLMCRQPEKRLGTRGGLQELRCHPWFKFIPSWTKAEEGGLPPPFYPTDFKKSKMEDPTQIPNGGEMGWCLGNGKYRTDGEVGALREVAAPEEDRGEWARKIEYHILENNGFGGDMSLQLFQLW